MMQFKGFKPEAMQRIAGTLGYQGDMNGFNSYLNQNPDKMSKMNMYQSKAMEMARGGMVERNYAVGGVTKSPTSSKPFYRGDGFARYDPREGPMVMPNPDGSLYRPPTNVNFRPSTNNNTVSGGERRLSEAGQALNDQRNQSGIDERLKTFMTANPNYNKDDPRNKVNYETDDAQTAYNKDRLNAMYSRVFTPYTRDVRPGEGSFEEYERSFRNRRKNNPNPYDQLISSPMVSRPLPDNTTFRPRPDIDVPERLDPSTIDIGPSDPRTDGLPDNTTFRPRPVFEDRTPPQTGEYTGQSIAEIVANRAINTGLPYGATVQPVGTEVYSDQLVNRDSGQVSGDISSPITTANTAQAMYEKQRDANTMNAATSAGQIANVLNQTEAAQGTVDSNAVVDAATGESSEGAKAKANTVDETYIDPITGQTRRVSNYELATAQGQSERAVQAEVAKADLPDEIRAAQTSVGPNEIPKAAQINENDMAFAVAQTDGQLTPQAVAIAAKMKNFNVSEGTLVAFNEGNIEAEDTVQGQLSNLMSSFEDGTPSWAAGAMRAANATMISRGMGGSSIAGAAIVQAAMESALPIAVEDAQAFRTMNMNNLSRQQQVSLTNAAAQQNVQLQNFNAEQQINLQNSQNAFSLQGMNLSNKQAVVLANAQIKAALQGQNLNNRQQANLVEAARYAEVNNINLSNRQQGVLQDNANELQINLANLGTRQQSYMANAQIAAALQGKKIDIKQQTAMQNAAAYASANNLTFSSAEQAKLHNSELMKTIGLANLSSSDAATLQNAARVASMDMANLSNRQQAAVMNAQTFMQMDLTNLSNQQQTELFRSQQQIQSLFTDQAATNAAAQFNASSENQTDQFFANLTSQTSQFNTSQINAQNQFNAGETNAQNRFAAEMMNQRDQFNAQNRLVIDQNNATWRRQVATADTVAINRANEINAQSVLDISNTAYNDLWSYYSDSMEWAWNSAENERQRIVDLATVKLTIDAKADIAALQSDYSSASAWGSLVATMFTSPLGGDTLLGRGLGLIS